MRGAGQSCALGPARPARGRRVGVQSWCVHEPSPALHGTRPLTDAARLPDAAPLLVYVMDVYDPQAYAYQPSVSALLTAARAFADIEVVQSGRVSSPLAAAGVIALLADEDLPVGTVLEAVQDAYFVGGRSLDTAEVLRDVALQLGLDAPAVELFGRSALAQQLAEADVELARDLGGSGGPLLLATKGERIYEFDGLGASGEHLVDQFRSVLAKP